MKAQIQRLLTVQTVVTVLFLLLVLISGWGDGFSALTGCLASLIPSGYFGYKMLRQADNDNAVEWLGYTYRSGIGKWLMAGLIFGLAFGSGYQWDPFILFAGYLLVQMSGMLVPFIHKGN